MARRMILFGVGVALIFGSIHLCSGLPAFVLVLLGGAMLCQLRIHHTLADPLGVLAILTITFLPSQLSPGPIRDHAMLLAFAGLSLFAGRSGWGTSRED